MRKISSLLEDLIKGSVCSYYWWVEEEYDEHHAKEKLSWCFGCDVALWFCFFIMLLVRHLCISNFLPLMIVALVIACASTFLFKTLFFKSCRYLNVIDEVYRDKYDNTKYRFLSFLFIVHPVFIIVGYCLIFCAKW